MLHGPLAGAVCDPEQLWQMTDDLLVAQAPWLPQLAAAIARAAALPGAAAHADDIDRFRKDKSLP